MQAYPMTFTLHLFLNHCHYSRVRYTNSKCSKINKMNVIFVFARPKNLNRVSPTVCPDVFGNMYFRIIVTFSYPDVLSCAQGGTG